MSTDPVVGVTRDDSVVGVPGDDSVVGVSQDDFVVCVTLNRPARRNALSRELLTRLIEVFADIRAQAEAGTVRAVVLTGSDPAFCAGLDLGEIAALGLPNVREFDVVGAVLAAGVPVIAAVNGPVATGGLEIVLACDFVIASDRAAFADTHSRVGVVPGWGLTARLPLAVGPGWARQMSATGNYVPAALAERIGLANEVVPHEELLPRALALAADIAGVDPGVLATIRSLYDAGAAAGAQAALDGERALWESGAALADSGNLEARRSSVLNRGRAQQPAD